MLIHKADVVQRVSDISEGEALVLKAVHQQKVPELLLFPSDGTLRFTDDSRFNCVCCEPQTAEKNRGIKSPKQQKQGET